MFHLVVVWISTHAAFIHCIGPICFGFNFRFVETSHLTDGVFHNLFSPACFLINFIIISTVLRSESTDPQKKNSLWRRKHSGREARNKKILPSPTPAMNHVQKSRGFFKFIAFIWLIMILARYGSPTSRRRTAQQLYESKILKKISPKGSINNRGQEKTDWKGETGWLVVLPHIFPRIYIQHARISSPLSSRRAFRELKWTP